MMRHTLTTDDTDRLADAAYRALMFYGDDRTTLPIPARDVWVLADAARYAVAHGWPGVLSDADERGGRYEP